MERKVKDRESKKKILITASTFPRWDGDTEPRFILDLAKAYQEYFDVTVLAPAAPGAETAEILEGVSVVRYHYFPVHSRETLCYPGAIVPRIREKKTRALLVPFLFLGLWWKLFRILPEFDFVHAHWVIPQGIVQSFFSKPYIITGHGGDVTSLNGNRLIKNLKRRSIRKAKAYTVVSKALRAESMEQFTETVPEIISMGYDSSTFGTEYRQENYFDQKGQKVVLFVGRLAEKKGVTYLIDAMKEVSAKLVIVGTGPLEEELKAQAEPFGEKIEFSGARTHEELKTIYASADLFVAPSVTAKDGDKEGLGLVLLEAMASGIPVIGSDSGGIPEVIEDGVNGILVPEKDVKGLAAAMNRLLSDEDLRKRMAEEGIKTAASREYRIIAKKYARLITGLERVSAAGGSGETEKK